MAAGLYNIIIQQGSTFDYQIGVKDPSGIPIDLTGAVIRGMIRGTYNDVSPLATFTINCPTPTNGIFHIMLSAAVTALFNFTKALYDIEIAYPNGTTDRILQGNVILSREVTK
jgi:hypothetical protein